MRCFPLLMLALVMLPVRAQDDELDKTVFGKRASEWVTILRSSEDVTMRRRALFALESAGPQTRKIFSEVGSALRLDKDEKVRVHAAQVLGKLGGRATDPERVAVEKISVKDAVLALAASLDKEKAPAVREAAATAVGRMRAEAGTAGVVALRDVLKDANADVRAAAAESLAKIGPDARTILKEINDTIAAGKTREDLRVRAGLIAAVQRIGRPDALPSVPSLIGLLKEEPLTGLSLDERRKLVEVRRQAVETLGVLGDAAAANVLTDLFNKAMEAKDVDMARSSVSALALLLGDKKPLVPVLVSAMAPPADRLQDRFVRCQAIHALGQLGKDLGDQRKTAVANLRRCLTDKLSEVKLAAALTIGELGPEAIGEEAPALVSELQVLKKSPEKPIAEAADAAIRRLEKKP